MNHRIVLPLSLVALCFGTTCLRAFVLPSFQLEECAWNATHIAIVSEGETIDGKVKVVESWGGDLKAGDSLTVPGLEHYARKEARRVHKFPAKPTKTVLSGKRIVVFLKKTSTGYVAAAGKNIPLAGIGVSSAWIENGEAFARSQMRISGGQFFGSRGSERKLRDRVFTVLSEKRKLSKALKQKDKGKRVSALTSLAYSAVRGASKTAIAEIEKLDRSSSFPVLRSLLQDLKLRSVPSLYVAQALVRLDPKTAAPHIAAAIRGQIRFWKE
ncbi:MAG: hypothetical protein AAF517_09020, partial [Planctomycetota bacterium]